LDLIPIDEKEEEKEEGEAKKKEGIYVFFTHFSLPLSVSFSFSYEGISSNSQVEKPPRDPLRHLFRCDLDNEVHPVVSPSLPLPSFFLHPFPLLSSSSRYFSAF